MATQPTNKDIGSEDPRDLKFNAGKVDEWATSTEKEYTDRKGVKRLTAEGMQNNFNASQADKEERFNNFLLSSGYVFLGDYELGPWQFSERNQYIRYDGQYWRLAASAPQDFATTGIAMTSFEVDKLSLVLMDDGLLRQELASSGGIDLTGYQAAFKTLPRTTGDRLRDEVYIMDYIPEEEHGAIRNYTSTYDCADAIEAALLDNNCALLPPGLFLVKRTLEVGSFKSLKGQFPGHMFFGGKKSSVIQSKTEYLGDGNPILKGSSTGATQSLTFENLVFVGDTIADHTNLAAMSSVGIVAVNVRGIKQGVQFLRCAFRNIKRAVDDEGAGDYVDKVTFDKCQFMYNYLAVKCFPTTTMAFANCFFDECYDWIEGADVHLQTCRFNNSSYSSVTCQIKADKIVAENPYFEGGSRWFSPSRYLAVRGGYFSEAFSITGADKFSIQLRGSNIYIDIEGVRVGTNTRLIDFDQVTDISKVKVRVVGCHAGSNFGNTTALSYYLARGLSFEGGANAQLDWNVVISGSPQLNGVAATNGDGVTRRFPNLNRSVYFDTSSIVFSLDFPQDIHQFPSTTLTLDQATFSLIGTNNGDGNNAAYFARLTIYNGYGSIWNYYLDGPSAAAYTVSLSSQSNTGVIVTITRVNAGRGDNLVMNSATENCKVTFSS